MDENEITTVADTQAENTADTADTGQTTPTTEELIQQLTARVAALEEIVGEEEYEPVSYTHLTLPTSSERCRSRWSPYH